MGKETEYKVVAERLGLANRLKVLFVQPAENTN